MLCIFSSIVELGNSGSKNMFTCFKHIRLKSQTFETYPKIWKSLYIRLWNYIVATLHILAIKYTAIYIRSSVLNWLKEKHFQSLKTRSFIIYTMWTRPTTKNVKHIFFLYVSERTRKKLRTYNTMIFVG